MNPTQIKMSTGAVYVGFLDWNTENYFLPMNAGCSLSFNKNDGRYDVWDIMDPALPLDVNIRNVTLSQTVVDESVIALVYSNYLGSWLAMMDEEGLPAPDYVHEYVDRMEPKFLEKSAGVSIRLKGRYTYYEGIGDSRADALKKEIEALQKSYGSTSASPTPCVDKVVKVDFGSKKP